MACQVLAAWRGSRSAAADDETWNYGTKQGQLQRSCTLEWFTIQICPVRPPAPKTHPMTSASPTPSPTAASASTIARDRAGALGQALLKSHEVRNKVEECVDDLASKNEAIKLQISQGETTLPAHESLQESEVVEAKVQECADDLQHVTEVLAKGVDDLKRVKVALADTQRALARTESSLSDAQEAESRSRHRALHDAATGLPNRSLFDDRLAQAIALAKRNQWTLAVMFLDLNHFKRINDDHGHAAGDVVLKTVASRLLPMARHQDTVCRNGGDEFLYLLVNPQGQDNVVRIARDILTNIARPMTVEGEVLSVRPSIGIALYPESATTGAELIAHADAAMYSAKGTEIGYAVWSDAAG